MSSSLAIGAVTAVLRSQIEESVIRHDLATVLGASPAISSLPPDKIAAGQAAMDRINLFLFQASENASWRNRDQPSRNGNGDRVSNPKLALDLHYLLTAYGAADFHAEVLLGHAMFVFHETPVLTRDAIRDALAALPGGALASALAAARLADQIEQIRIAPRALNVEEISKIWTALQSQYRTTAAYQVSVVLIEGTRSTKSALPVRMRNVKVSTWRHPVIEVVEPEAAPEEWIFEGSPLAVRGYQLRGDITRVRFGTDEVTPSAANTFDDRITVSVPAGLRAGVQGVQVIHRLALSAPPPPGLPASPDDPHRGFESNVAPFVLHPVIESPGPIPPAVPVPIVSGVTPTLENGSPVVVDGVTLQSANVVVSFAPRVGRSQRVVLLLNERNPPNTRPARSHSFPAPVNNGIVAPNQPDTSTIVFAIDFVAPGNYLVRVQVEGAESPLGVDVAGNYVSPAISI